MASWALKIVPKFGFPNQVSELKKLNLVKSYGLAKFGLFSGTDKDKKMDPVRNFGSV